MKRQKGITLIALIITIIVMLILVGVTINVALNGGLFRTVDEATTKTEKEAMYDQIVGVMKLKNNGDVDVKGTYEAVVDIFGTDKVTLTNPGAVDENTTEVIFKVTGNRGTYTYQIKENEIARSKLLEQNYTLTVGERTITIPAGFGVVDTTGDKETLLEDVAEYKTYITEENIKNGIVIQDEVGNEFVWIPVDDINSMVMCQSAEEIPEGAPEGTDGRCTLELQGEILKCTKHNSEDLAGKLYATGIYDNFDAELTGQKYKSTLREPINLTTTKTLSTTDVGETGVKPGTYAYDSQQMFTVYGGGEYSATMYQTEFNLMSKSVAKYGGFYVGRYETGGFNETKVVSKSDRGMNGGGDINYTNWYKMYKMQKDFGNDIVGSSMIWGCQYDQVMKFVDGKNNFSVTTADSSRHVKNEETGTGNVAADFVANIYDLEGNMCEWSLEAQSTSSRIYRGGYCTYVDTASHRNASPFFFPEKTSRHCWFSSNTVRQVKNLGTVKICGD